MFQRFLLYPLALKPYLSFRCAAIIRNGCIVHHKHNFNGMRCMIKSNNKTAWRQLFSCRTAIFMQIIFRLPRGVERLSVRFFDVFLPMFIDDRENISFIKPFSTATKTAGRPCTFRTEEIMVLVLCGLKRSVRRQQLFLVFELFPTYVLVWL